MVWLSGWGESVGVGGFVANLPEHRAELGSPDSEHARIAFRGDATAGADPENLGLDAEVSGAGNRAQVEADSNKSFAIEAAEK